MTRKYKYTLSIPVYMDVVLELEDGLLPPGELDLAQQLALPIETALNTALLNKRVTAAGGAGCALVDVLVTADVED